MGGSGVRRKRLASSPPPDPLRSKASSGPLRRAQDRLAIRADQDEQTQVGAEQGPGAAHGRLEDLLEVGERRDGLRDRVQGIGGRGAGLDLVVAGLERCREPVHAPERPAREACGEQGDDEHHEQRVPREREVGVEDGVAQQLDDAHDDRGKDDGEPAHPSRDHRISRPDPRPGPGGARPPGRRSTARRDRAARSDASTPSRRRSDSRAWRLSALKFGNELWAGRAAHHVERHQRVADEDRVARREVECGTPRRVARDVDHPWRAGHVERGAVTERRDLGDPLDPQAALAQAEEQEREQRERLHGAAALVLLLGLATGQRGIRLVQMDRGRRAPSGSARRSRCGRHGRGSGPRPGRPRSNGPSPRAPAAGRPSSRADPHRRS